MGFKSSSRDLTSDFVWILLIAFESSEQNCAKSRLIRSTNFSLIKEVLFIKELMLFIKELLSTPKKPYH